MLILILLLMKMIFLIHILSYRTVRTIIICSQLNFIFRAIMYSTVQHSTLRNGFFANNNDHLSHSPQVHVHV